jgi:hypothetical protein
MVVVVVVDGMEAEVDHIRVITWVEAEVVRGILVVQVYRVPLPLRGSFNTPLIWVILIICRE